MFTSILFITFNFHLFVETYIVSLEANEKSLCVNHHFIFIDLFIGMTLFHMESLRYSLPKYIFFISAVFLKVFNRSCHS